MHLIRAATRFVSYGQRKTVAAALKTVYQAADEDAAKAALDAFEASELGATNPNTVRVFRDAWTRFVPFLAFPPMPRRVIYTTNSIESLNYQLRKIIKNHGHFPTDDAVVKRLWLAICNIEDKRARDRAKEHSRPRGAKRNAEGRLVEGQITTNWKQALAQLALAYPERIKPYLQTPAPLHKQLDRLWVCGRARPAQGPPVRRPGRFSAVAWRLPATSGATAARQAPQRKHGTTMRSQVTFRPADRWVNRRHAPYHEGVPGRRGGNSGHRSSPGHRTR